MAISSETSALTFTGNNSTVTAYAITFPFSGASEIVVTRITAAGVRTTLAVTTGYTLSGDTAAGAGQLVTIAAIPGTDTLLVERFTSAVQSLDSDSPAGSYPTSIEAQLDRSTRAIQDNKRIASRNFARSLRLPDGETAAEIPAATLRKGKVLYFNATTGAIETKTPNEILLLSDGAPDGIGLPSGGTAGQYLQALGGGLGQWVTITPATIGAPETDGTGADAELFRTALEVETDNFARPENGWWLFKALEAFDSNLPPIGTYVTVAAFGDSVAYRAQRALCLELIHRYGQGALGTLLVSGNNTEGTSITDGADLSTATTSATLGSVGATYSPGLRMYDIAAGGNLTITVPSNAPRAGDWSKLTVIYGDRSGGGTLDIDVTQAGSVVINESIATAGTAALKVVEYDLTDGLLPGVNPSIVLSAVSASVYVLGVMLWRTRGVVPLALNIGGQSLDTQNGVPTASLDLYNTTFAPALMVHHMLEEDTTGADAEVHLDRMVTHFPQTTHLVIGMTPTSTNDSNNVTTKAFWRTLAEERGFPFFDAHRSLWSYSNVDALGWEGDGTHLDAAAYKYISHCIMARFPAAERLYNRAKTMKEVALAQAHEFAKVPLHLMTLLNKQTSNGVIYDNGSSNTPDSRYYFGTSGAGAGYAVGMLMSANSSGNALPVASVIRLRVRTAGIIMATGTTAWIQIGGSGLLTAPSKAVKSLGIEFANPADVGLTGGLSNAAVRLWCYDGATLTEGPWVALAAFSSTSAYTFSMRYEPGKLTLVGSVDQATVETVITAIRCTLAASTIGYNVYAGAASTGATVGSIKINNADLTPLVPAFDVEPWTR